MAMTMVVPMTRPWMRHKHVRTHHHITSELVAHSGTLGTAEEFRAG
jgi:hypothetical protein